MSEEPVTVTLTCHTEGCENAGVPIPVLVPADVGGAVCGACSQEITDVTGDPLPPLLAERIAEVT